MIKRSERVAYMEVVDGTKPVYKRLTGFTEFTISKNAKEYSRKYIDENMERSEVISYSPSISYKFDVEPGNLVHELLYNVAKDERYGEEAQCNLLIADMLEYDGNQGVKAVMRKFTVIPQSEGDDRDTYTVSGTLRAIGGKSYGTARTSDNWKTVTFEKL